MVYVDPKSHLYACRYVCVCVCVCARAWERYLCGMVLCVFVVVGACVSVCMYDECIHVCMCVTRYVCVCVCAYVCMCVGVFVYVYVYVCMCVCMNCLN